jgi:hypothetical protein
MKTLFLGFFEDILRDCATERNQNSTNDEGIHDSSDDASESAIGIGGNPKCSR